MRQIVCNIACKTASLQQEQRWWWWWLWSVCDAGAHPSALCLRTPVGTNQSPRRDGSHQSCCSVKFEKAELLSFFFREWFGSELGCQATRWTLRVPATGGRAVEATPAMDTATMGEWTNFLFCVTSWINCLVKLFDDSHWKLHQCSASLV